MDKQRSILACALVLMVIGHLISWFAPTEHQVYGNVLFIIAALGGIAGFMMGKENE